MTSLPPASEAAHAPGPEHPEVRPVIGASRFRGGRLRGIEEPAVNAPSIMEVRRMLLPHRAARGWMLSGGEPTLRPDLPELLRALAADGAPDLGIATDGLALGSGEVVGKLRALGLRRARITLHSARRDAHDWLVGARGAARKALLAMRSCRLAGIRTEIETVVTRPTMPYLSETIALVAGLGAGEVHLRLLDARQIADDDFVVLTPRAGLLQGHLEEASEAATASGARLVLHGFPECVAGKARSRLAAARSELWLVPAAGGSAPDLAPFAGDASVYRCAECPGAASCDGVPARYVGVFGWGEFESCDTVLARPEPEAAPLPSGRPPPRGGRRPATRLSFAAGQAGVPGLSGDPLPAVPSSVPDVIRVTLDAPARIACPECGDHGRRGTAPTRTLRRRLVRAAQEGAALLRIADSGSLAHPSVGDLLAETGKLSFRRVEIAGEASALDGLLDQEMRRLAHVARFDLAVFGPDAASHDEHVGRPGAFDAAMRAGRRLASVTGVAVGAYAVLHDSGFVPAYASAWGGGRLPGHPSFRLSRRGAALADLARAAQALPAGPARDALAAVLPPCLLDRSSQVHPAVRAVPAYAESPSDETAPSGSDPHGTFDGCPHASRCDASDRCPGLASGWADDGIHALAGPRGGGG